MFCIGVVVQTAAFAPSSIFGGTPISGRNAITRLTARTSRQAVLSPVWASDPSVWLSHCTSGSLSRARALTRPALTWRSSAELAPPEVRGSLVALQQLAITFGIMVSFWIDFGTNYIGGTGAGQSEASWRVALALQLVPAIILGVGILAMPFSPRWLVNNGRDDEALQVLSRARRLPPDSDLVQIEFL